MISAASFDDAVSVLTDTHSATTKGDKAAFGFGEIFSSVSEKNFQQPGTDRVAGDEEAGSGSLAEKTDEDPAVSPELITQLMQLIGQYANPENQALVASTQETITGVLEGNGVSGDTDIASALTELQNCFSQLGSNEKEAILARMPQATKLFEEPDSAAKQMPLSGGSISCPLENPSETTGAPTVQQTQTGMPQDAGDTAGQTAEQTADFSAITATYVSAEAEAGGIEAAGDGDHASDPETQAANSRTQTAIPETEAARSATAANSHGNEPALSGTEAASAITDSADETQSGDASTGDGVGEGEKDTGKTDRTQAAANRDYFQSAATVKDETAENGTADAVRTATGSALEKLTDILSSYDGSDNNRFEIQLEPENLGKLSISLMMGEDGLRALIRTKDTQVQGLLSSEINMLVDKLSENGVQIKSMDVVCADMGGEQFDSQYSGNANSGQNAPSYGSRRPDDIESAYEELGSTQIYAWASEELIGSTVSYRA